MKLSLCPALPLHSPCPLTGSLPPQPVYSSDQQYMPQAVNSLDLTSLPTIMQTCFWIFLFFSGAFQGHLGLWLQGAVLFHTSQTRTFPLLPLWSHLLLPMFTLSPFPNPRCLPWTHHCPQRDAGTERRGAGAAVRQQQMQCQVPRGFRSSRKRLINQRGFIKEPGEPLKNLELCLRGSDFRSCSI